MKRVHAVAALGVAVAVLLAATPVGVWLTARAAETTARSGSWELKIGTAGGGLIIAPRFGQVEAYDTVAGWSVQVEEVALDPWGWQLRVTAPRVRLDSPARSDTTAQTRPRPDSLYLPLARLPAMRLVDGRFDWSPSDQDGPQLRCHGITAVLGAHDPAVGTELELTVDGWSWGTDSTALSGDLHSLWVLAPEAASLRESQVRWQRPGPSEGTLQGHGRLDLTSALAMEAELRVDGHLGTVRSTRLDVEAAGSLAPLQVSFRAAGEASEPSIGPVGVAARGRLATAVVLDTVILQLAGGTIRGHGRYEMERRTVQAEAALDGIELGGLPAGGLTGTVDGRASIDGSLDRPRGTLHLSVPALSGMAPEPLDLAVDASLLDGTVQLTANSRRLGRLSASGEASLESGEHDLQLTGDVDAGLWLGRTLTTAVRGRWRPRTLELRLTAARLPFGDDAPGPLEVDASLRQYRYLDASVRVGDGQIFARMGADLITGRLDTLATLIDGVELSTLAPVPVSGLVRGRAAAGGVLGLAGHGGIRLRADDLRLAGWDLGPTTLTAAFGSGQAQLQARAPGVDVEATVDTAGQAHLRATLADAQLLRAHEDGVDSVSLTGRLQVEGSLREAAAAAAEAHVEALTATVGGWPLALVGAMQIDYRQRRGRWTEARLGTPIGELQLRDGWTAGDSLDVMAAIDSLVPAPIDGLTGRGQATLRVTGTRSAPEAVLQAQVDDVALDGRHLGSLTMTLALRDRLRGALELRQDTLGEGSLVVSLTAPATLFLADAASDAGDRARLRWTAQDLDASWLATYVLQDSTGMAISGSGELQLPALRGLDGVRWGELRGGMHLRQLRVERPRVRLRLREAAEAVVARGRATIEEFELPVEIHRRGTDRYDAAGSVLIGGRWTEAGGGFQVRLRDVDLPAVGQALPGRGTDLPEGTVRAQVDVTASPQWAARATMELDIDDLGTVEARLSGDDDAWTGRADWITLVEDSLSVTARAPSRGRWPAWDALEARAWSSGIDLMALLDQVPELESLSGRVRTELRGDSLGSAPTVTGHLEVEDLSLSLFDVRPGYRMPGGRVDVAAREGGGFRAELVGFVGETTRGKGRIRLDGWLDVIDTRQLDYALRLVTEGVPYNYDDVFETQQVRADLALSSQDGGSLLAGTVRLEDSLADFQLVDLTSPPVPPPPAIPNPLLEGMALDVYVDVEDLQTRSELSDVRVEGQVRAYGSFYKPRFQGELEVTEGTVILLSRPFTLSRGRIVVDRLLPTYSILDLIYDPILLDPELDLEAVARVKPQQETEEREVTLSLEGPVLAAAPRLTSPGLVDQQILGLLAFGSIEQDRFNYSGALYTAAGQLLLGRRAQQAGLDEFLLLPSGTALGTVGETSLRVGKHLAWPVPIWLRYEALANEPSLGQFEAEYGITSWLKIDATAHSKYELYGLGIGVSKDF